jgi:fructose-specific phosphotransferase system component IIB
MTEKNYLEEQMKNCVSGGSVVDIKLELGVWRSAKCPSEIDWFEASNDFIIIERGGDGIKVALEDGTPNGSWKSYTPGLVEGSRTLTIKADLKHKLYQKFMQIEIENQGTLGEVFKIYASGGFHFRITLTDLDSGLIWQQVWLNLMSENFIDTFWQDFSNNEDGVELSFKMVNDPIFFLEGTLDTNFAIPENLEDVKVENSGIVVSQESITISDLKIVDNDMVAFDESLKVTVFGLGTELADVNVEESTIANDLIIPGNFSIGEEYLIKYYYKYNSNIYNLIGSEVSLGTLKK